MTAVPLYIHIPFCRSKCAYCDFFSVPCQAVPDSYVDALCREIAFRMEAEGVSSCPSVYIGGGTPSLLSPGQFRRILAGIPFARDCECTVEVNPDDVTELLLAELAAAGVSRISCGIQSLDERVLREAGRRAMVSQNLRALELLSQKWPGVLSVDVISGLPGETEASFVLGLRRLCGFNPAHVSLYSLALEEGSALGARYASGALDYDFDFADGLWLAGRDFLEENGWAQYEVSNFCRDGAECRHNRAYWLQEDYMGAGSGATGTTYKKASGCRRTNTTDISRYTKFWNSDECRTMPGAPADVVRLELLDEPTLEFEFFMLGLRMRSGISESRFKSRFGRPLPQDAVRRFEDYAQKGLCRITRTAQDTTYALTRQGILFLNDFIAGL